MPVVDLRNNFQTRTELEFFENFFLTVPFIAESIDLYIPKDKDRQSILAPPILMNKSQAKRMPPTLIIVSEVDPLRSEGEAFAKLLQGAGVECAILRAHGQLHDSVTFEATRGSPTAKAEVTLAATLLKEALGVEQEMAFDNLTHGKKRTMNGHEDAENGEEGESKNEPKRKQPTRKRRRRY
jgi:acetyl esterase